MNIEQLLSVSNYYFNIHAVPFFISGILIAAEALFVYSQNKKSPLNFGFAAVTLFAGIWLTGIGFIYSSANEAMAIFWSRNYCWLGIIFVSPGVFLFSAAIEQKSFKRSLGFIYANYVVALAFYIFCITTPHFIEGLWTYSWGYYPKAGWGQNFFMIWFGTLMVLSFRNFIRSFKRETIAIKKKQVKFIIIAFIFGGIGGSIDYFGNYGVPLYPFGSLSVFLFLTVTAYSIVNYKLMDIETVLHKTILWVLSFSIIMIPIFLSYRWAFAGIKDSAFYRTVFWLASFIVFALYLRLVQPHIDHVFQRRMASLERISNRFVSDLVHLKGLNNLTRYIEQTIDNSLYPQWVDIFIRNEREKIYTLANRLHPANRPSVIDENNAFLRWLSEHNLIAYKEYIELDPMYAPIKEAAKDYFKVTQSVVAIPLILNEQLLGIINLDRKANLRRYSGLDFRFLNIIRNQSAIAISNSLIYQNIEEQVAQRTAELVNVQKQLVQAEKLATVGTLSGGVAHEINNPLTAILTNVQMLLAFGEGKDEVSVDRESLELIEEATQRCRTIVQKLMTYAKKPLKSSEMQEIDVLDVLKKVMAFLEYQLQQEDVKITLEANEDNYNVMGNHNELEQVVTNLILNARDAIAHSGKMGHVEIMLKKSENRVKIEVKDDGIGIPENILNKIFDPFFTTKDVGKGLGLGLSICQSIIEKHKGQITARSKPGEGTVFTITLPQYSHIDESQENANVT